MDFSLISAASAALNSAMQIGRAAIGVRDFNQVEPEIAKLNDLLLKAQDALFAHNAQLLALQQENFEAREKLRELEEAIRQRASYSLFQITEGNFVYRMDPTPERGRSGEPLPPKPEHYVCQQCFDGGVLSVLGLGVGSYGARAWVCHACTRWIDLPR